MRQTMWFLFLLAGAARAGEPGPEWPLYQGGPGFSGRSPDETVKPPFRLVWTYRLDGDATGDAGGGVTVADGQVYVNVLNTRSLLALDAETGRLRWEYTASYAGYRTVPSYSRGRLFLWERLPAKKPRVLALDAATGKVLWEHPLRPDHLSAVRVGLAVAGGNVYCAEAGDEPAVLALDEATGKEVWRVGLGRDGGSAVTPPSIAGGRIYVATHTAVPRGKVADEGAIVALDAQSGEILWRRKGNPSSRPLFTDGEAVAATFWNDGKLRLSLLDAATGQTRWTFFRTFGIYNPPGIAFHKDFVVVKPYGGSFHVADRATGKELRTFNGITNSGCGTPALAGRFAFVGTGVFDGDLEAIKAFRLVDAPREKGRCGSLHAVDLETGKSVWFFGTGNTVCGDPAIAYGRLYFSSRDGNVYCFAPARHGEPTLPDAVDGSEPVAEAKVEALVAEPTAPGTVKGWPMSGGNAHRSASAAELRLPQELAWKSALGDRIACSAAIVDGGVFVGSDAGKIVGLNAADGRTRWEFDAGAPVRCSPAVMNGIVYCGSDRGTFHALDANDGKPKWSFACGGAIQASPVVLGGVVLFGANDHHLYALDRHTGEKLWAFRMRDYATLAPPVVHGRHVFVAQWQDWVYRLDLFTGKEQWRSFIPVSIESLAFARDRLYARSPNYLVEMDPRTGQRLRIGSLTYGYGGLGFARDLVYHSGIKSQYGGIGAGVIDLSESDQEMKTKIPGLEDVRILRAKSLKGSAELAAMTAPLVLGGKVCFATAKGKLTLTDPDGKVLWSHPLGGTCHGSPVSADGLLVVGCDDGYLYAFRPRP